MSSAEKSVYFDVDKVFCISIKNRSDRRDSIIKEFSSIKNPIEFILVDRNKENPEKGCYDSHVHCARLALKHNYKRVLILEDDATFFAPEQKQVSRINNFLRIRNPSLFYLGGMIGRMWLIPWPGVVRCRLTGTHAYILSRKGCQKLASSKYEGIAIDSYFCRKFKAYSCYPIISQQQPESIISSDIMDYRDLNKGSKNLKDEEYWKENFESQKKSLKKNWARTFLLRYL
ncbi:glycosyl transferase, family 25 [Kushneria avicenniae]|uniref:Glycosyl transferase, family 25 n=1 Tax=Kushneria avicenniae TaxID=402385 RepID=A0A1I1IE72_9GAMM|nr:glycosyltransferase family 25 protein [Kushneria avicenniae]SFC32538.1 glycosyl transferase, family 25 [Kushneria avicenniae]